MYTIEKINLLEGVKPVTTSVPFNKILADPSFSRRVDLDIDSMVSALANNGIHRPLSTTEEITSGKDKGKYFLVDGFRRYKAIERMISKGLVKNDYKIPIEITCKITK